MFYKSKEIIKEGSKVFEKAEIDKTEVQKQIDLLTADKVRRLKEVGDEYDVKITELNKYL